MDDGEGRRTRRPGCRDRRLLADPGAGPRACRGPFPARLRGLAETGPGRGPRRSLPGDRASSGSRPGMDRTAPGSSSKRKEFDKALTDLDRAAGSRPGENEREMLSAAHGATPGRTITTAPSPNSPRSWRNSRSNRKCYWNVPATFTTWGTWITPWPTSMSSLGPAQRSIGRFLSRVFPRGSWPVHRGVPGSRSPASSPPGQPVALLPAFLAGLDGRLPARPLAGPHRMVRVPDRAPAPVLDRPAPCPRRFGPPDGHRPRGALADMDRCIDLIPCLSFPYGWGRSSTRTRAGSSRPAGISPSSSTVSTGRITD